MAFCRTGDGEQAYRLLNMLNPIHATADFRLASRYEREPYVLAADVSSGFPNDGKGGWSWYTGAAGWFYRAVLQSFLGFRKEGEYLEFVPCVSSTFNRYFIEYRYQSTLYEITFIKVSDRKRGAVLLSLDGEPQEGNRLLIENDGTVHHVEVRFGA